jgi:hypothetical protein
MSLKSSLGLDGFDLAIQGTITAVLMGLFIGLGGDEEGLAAAAMVLSGSLVLLAIRRSLAMRKRRRLEGDGVADQRVVELEQRVADLEAAQARIYELEERLDFAERLLAREPEVRRLPAAEVKQS